MLPVDRSFCTYLLPSFYTGKLNYYLCLVVFPNNLCNLVDPIMFKIRIGMASCFQLSFVIPDTNQ